MRMTFITPGQDNAEASRQFVSIPTDLIRERSTVLKERVDADGDPDMNIELGIGSDSDTVNTLIAWATAAIPQVYEHYGLKLVAHLAIVADELRMWALSNQAIDMLEQLVHRDRWCLTPDVVDAVYDRVGHGRPLRRWMADHAEHIGCEVRAADPAAGELWKRVFLRHPALGWDSVQPPRSAIAVAGLGGRRETRPAPPPAADSCRYHEHPWLQPCGVATGEDEVTPPNDMCPYLFDDCYALWTREAVEPAEAAQDAPEALAPTVDEVIWVASKNTKIAKRDKKKAKGKVILAACDEAPTADGWEITP